MNLLDLIRTKANSFPNGQRRQGIDAVILHIETAEKYWKFACNSSDSNMFTDVIYRSNQAFEGTLKEAYEVLADRDPSNKTPYEIEMYLSENSIFRDRVLSLFTRYRKDWRNQAAHDYKLFFDEQEAILAITSVTTFCNILLDQMLSKSNEEHEKLKASEFSMEIISSIGNYNTLNLVDKLTALIKRSYYYLMEGENPPQSKLEFNGQLAGFIKAIDPSLVIRQEVIVDSNKRYQADFVFSSDGESVIVETQRSKNGSLFLERAESQLRQYMTSSSHKEGLLVFYKPGIKESIVDRKEELPIDSRQQNITYIVPYES
ncbi:hypothetical protein [Aliamphritea hakodatensis]|uniref:hypothetical protein n=1 Tax=Aliamphritea hakodatensis TaxID=2895352 RepID=UPI0022FD4B59|nr:hypothetical protein [Aliamphritea hakodatensis]